MGRPDKYPFMNIAQGSLEDCHYYVIPAEDLGYTVTTEWMFQLEEVGKLLNAYSKSLTASS